MKRAVISGATGAIGTALIENLISNGIEVLILMREGSDRKTNIKSHPLIKIKYSSLENYKSLKNDTGKNYDVFYHFAWAGTFGNTRNDMYLQNKNVEYTLDAVSVAKEFGCQTFIGAGSQAEYGRAEGVLTALTPTFPENGYGIAKLCAGQMSREYAHQMGLRHIWVRILSVYGPNDGSQTMVMSTINKLQKGEIADLTKGEQMWDYLYSADAAEAFKLLGERGQDGKVYVLGSGVARPLKEYIEIIGKSLNSENLLNFGSIPYSQRQVMYLCADVSELSKDTGWEAKTSFKEGIAKILEQIKKANKI